MNIEKKIKFDKKVKEIRKKIKPEQCIFCGNKKLARSHSIPERNLNEISPEVGHIESPETILAKLNESADIPIIREKIGKREFGTFQLICSNCDSSLFSTYENMDNIYFDEENRPQIYTEIALKSSLFDLGNKTRDMWMFEESRLVADENDDFIGVVTNNHNSMMLYYDVYDLLEEVLFYYSALKSKARLRFTTSVDIIVEENLGIAMNSIIVPYYSIFHQEHILSENLKYSDRRVGNMFSYIYTRKNKSRIILFHRKRDGRYNRISKEPFFTEFNFEHFIVWLLLYTENFAISSHLVKKIDKTVLAEVFTASIFHTQLDNFEKIFYKNRDNLFLDES